MKEQDKTPEEIESNNSKEDPRSQKKEKKMKAQNEKLQICLRMGNYSTLNHTHLRSTI